MGIKNLFTKKKKEEEFSDATLELQRELRQIKRKRIVNGIVKEVKTLGPVLLAAYGLGTIIGEVIVGVKKARLPEDQKRANRICNRLLNGRPDEYESMIIATGPKGEDGKLDLIFSASTNKEFGKEVFEELSKNLKEN